MSGKLYIVPTPVGNLDDMPPRAIEVLKNCNIILAEDTRSSGVLMKHFGINTPMYSHHKFNEHESCDSVINKIKSGEIVALVSDAGTPGIADPAFNLVRECVREGITVCPVPGACAMINALIASGLPTDRFRFENFSPKKSAQRLRVLEDLKTNADSTVIFYASPHNLLKFLEEIKTVFGDITIVLARELTKKFEEHLRGTPEQLLEHYKERTPKGEFVLMFHPQGKGGMIL